MTFVDWLLSQGAVPKGIQAKTVLEPGGKPDYYDTSWSGRLLRGLEKVQGQQTQKVEDQFKMMSRNVDMYKTLRDAGYSPERAYKAVSEKKFPEAAGGISMKEEQEKANLEKTKAETEKIKSETSGYEEKDKIEDPNAPLVRSSKFREGKGIVAKFSRNVARLNETTKTVIGNMKVRADLDELLKNRELYEAQGVDVEAILEYFGKTE